MRKLILLTGHAGTGKSYVSKILAKQIMPCIYLNKDHLDIMTDEILKLQGAHQHDRASKIYLDKVRPIEYKTLLQLIKSNIDFDVNIIADAPFGKELKDSKWMNNLKVFLDSKNMELCVIWVESSAQKMKNRIISRGSLRDTDKLENWSDYIQNIKLNTPFPESININNDQSWDQYITSQIQKHFSKTELQRSLHSLQTPIYLVSYF